MSEDIIPYLRDQYPVWTCHECQRVVKLHLDGDLPNTFCECQVPGVFVSMTPNPAAEDWLSAITGKA